jgi:hypothetical protein
MKTCHRNMTPNPAAVDPLPQPHKNLRPGDGKPLRHKLRIFFAPSALAATPTKTNSTTTTSCLDTSTSISKARLQQLKYFSQQHSRSHLRPRLRGGSSAVPTIRGLGLGETCKLALDIVRQAKKGHDLPRFGTLEEVKPLLLLVCS